MASTTDTLVSCLESVLCCPPASSGASSHQHSHSAPNRCAIHGHTRSQSHPQPSTAWPSKCRLVRAGATCITQPPSHLGVHPRTCECLRTCKLFSSLSAVVNQTIYISWACDGLVRHKGKMISFWPNDSEKDQHMRLRNFLAGSHESARSLLPTMKETEPLEAPVDLIFIHMLREEK